MMDSELITVSEASALSGYTPQHIRLLIRQGSVSARRAGGIWLIEVSSLQTYIVFRRLHQYARQLEVIF